MGDPVLKGEHRWQRLPDSPGVDQCADCGAMRCLLQSGLELVVSSPLASRAANAPCYVRSNLTGSDGNSEGSDDHQA